MSRAIRSLRWVALGILAVVALAGALIAFAVGTTSGGRLVLDLFAPAELTVELLEGHLGGDLRLVGVRHEGERAEVRVEDLRVRWSPRSLLGRALVVERLRADGVSVRLRPAREPDPEPSDVLPQLRLPVRVQIDSALLADVTVHPAPPEGGEEPTLEEPVRVERLALQGTVSREGRIDLRAAARAPAAQPELDVRARLQGRLTARGDYPLDLRVDWSARPAGDPPLAGQGRLSGDLARLRLGHTLRRPTTARLEGRVRDLLGDDLAWEGVLELPRFRLSAVRADWPPHGLEARVQAAGGRDWVRGRASARLHPEAGGEVTADLAGRYEEERLRLDSLVLGAPPTEGRLVARGEVGFGADRPDFRLAGSWRDVAWPPVTAATEAGGEEEPVARSPAGSFRLQGTMAAYELSMRARLEGAELPGGDWSLEAEGDTAALAVRTLRGRTMDGEVRGSGRVAWAPRAAWRLALEAKGLRTDSLVPAWPGEVSVRLRTTGAVDDGRRTAVLEVRDLSGELRGEPLEGELDLRLDGERVTAEALRLSLGDAELEGSGAVGRSWDVRWSLRVPDLSVLALDTIRPDLGGAVRAEGNVTGRREAPALATELEIEALDTRQVRIDRVEGDVALDLSGDSRSRLSLEAEGIEGEERQAPWLSLERAALSGEGTPDDHRLTVEAGTSADSFRVVLTGGVPLDGRALAWTGSVEELTLRTPRSDWDLRAPGRLRAGADAVRLEELCWEGRMEAPEEPDSRLCASGAWARGAGGTAAMEAVELPLALLRPFLPPDVEVGGTASGRLAGSAGPEGELRGSAELRAGPGELRYEVGPGQPVTRPYQEVSLDARIQAGELDASLALSMDGGTVEGRVRVPVEATEGARALEGTVRGRFEDRGLTGALTLDLDETAGTLEADLTLGGTVEEPRALGELQLTGGRADVLPFGLLLEDVRLRGESDQADRWTLSGSATSGPGTLEMDGTASLGVDAPWEADLRLRGERFEAYNTAHASVVVTPELRARGDPDGILVTGDVHIPEARIAPQDLQLMAIEPSEDVILVGPEGTEEEPAEELERSVPVPIRAEVRLTTGDSVHLDAFGVEGRLEGTLLVSYASGQPTRASGELDVVDGTYTAYYQELSIERGRLVFADAALGNPGLDIRVTRQPREQILVGLEIGGTAREPSAMLFSEPPMPEAEALSWLVLGRSLSRAEEGDGELLTSAARSAGLAGGEFLAARLAAAFGLEEARVERGADGASFLLGARLAPNLFVAYTIGLFDEGDILQVRYDFGRWTLSTQTGFETAADLLYRAGGEEEGSPELAPPGPGDEPATGDDGR